METLSRLTCGDAWVVLSARSCWGDGKTENGLVGLKEKIPSHLMAPMPALNPRGELYGKQISQRPASISPPPSTSLRHTPLWLILYGSAHLSDAQGRDTHFYAPTILIIWVFFFYWKSLNHQWCNLSRPEDSTRTIGHSTLSNYLDRKL